MLLLLLFLIEPSFSKLKCDMINRYEFDVTDIVFMILAKKEFLGFVIVFTFDKWLVTLCK